MKKTWYKKDVLFYSIIFVLSAVLYFFLIKQMNSKAADTSVHVKKTLKKFIINDSILQLKNISDTTSTLNSFLSKRNGRNVAVVLIDGGCSVCLKTLLNWKSFIEQNHIEKERIVFVGYDASIKQLNYSMKEIVNLDCKMFIDNSYLLGTLNHIGQDSELKTFIIDRNLNIVIQNDPFLHLEIQPLFVKLLKQ